MVKNNKNNYKEKKEWLITNVSIWYGNKNFHYNKAFNYQENEDKKIKKLNENIFEEAFNSIEEIDNYALLLQKLLPVFNTTFEEFENNNRTGRVERSFDKDINKECIGGVSKKPFLKKIIEKYEVKKDYLNNITIIKDSLTKSDNSKLNEEDNHYYSIVYDNSLPTETPLVCGLGAAHVLETALTLHHIWGVPYIPGSSLKGVCRQVAFWKLLENFQKKFYGELAIDNEDMLVYQLLFGAQDFKGLLLFLDAYPECQNNEKIFKLDIMNPHYSKYYGDSTGRTPPGDCENPTPIFFLTVKEGVNFRFVVLFDNWRWEKIKKEGILIVRGKEKYLITNNVTENSNEEKNIIKKNLPIENVEKMRKNEVFFSEILKDALSFYGIGSKTRLGYGSFKV
jgi:CRISPR-associated protein Cmr6